MNPLDWLTSFMTDGAMLWEHSDIFACDCRSQGYDCACQDDGRCYACGCDIPAGTTNWSEGECLGAAICVGCAVALYEGTLRIDEDGNVSVGAA